jgi:hypothetical protein
VDTLSAALEITGEQNDVFVILGIEKKPTCGFISLTFLFAQQNNNVSLFFLDFGT